MFPRLSVEVDKELDEARKEHGYLTLNISKAYKLIAQIMLTNLNPLSVHGDMLPALKGDPVALPKLEAGMKGADEVKVKLDKLASGVRMCLIFLKGGTKTDISFVFYYDRAGWLTIVRDPS